MRGVNRMSVNGLLINVEYCSGCKACEIACRQEHNLPIDVDGIKVYEMNINKGQTFNNIPIPTNMCDLCEDRVAKGKRPSCVQHCMAMVMEYGPVEELAKKMATKEGYVLWTPKKKDSVSPITGESLKKCEE